MPRVVYSYHRQGPGLTLLSFGAILLILFFLSGAFLLFAVWRTVPLRFDWQSLVEPRGLLISGMPVLVRAETTPETSSSINTRAMLLVMQSQFFSWQSPRSILQSQLLLPDQPPAVHPPPAASPETVVKEQDRARNLSKDNLVAIYHTHTGETYILSDSTARVDGKRGGVVAVGEAVKQVLESKYGIRTDHDQTINDANYNTSYMISEQTARKILADNKNIQVLLDIHRDAGLPRKDCLVTVNGQEVAPILFVVGSNARAPFPNWRQNYQFAQQLAAAINKKYPGLVRGVRVKEGRYNQFLHPRALLVEVGSANNSTGEAVAAGKLFADVLGQEVTKLIQNQKAKNAGSSRPDQSNTTRPDESTAQTRGE